MDETLLNFAEKCTFRLRSLYQKFGYQPYKMGKFEEYELYVRNKDFLVSDRVIAFSDTNGKMMALKPDVTLSIIKNGEDVPGVKQKVYYSENVYRVSESTHHFKEIMQNGLECIGDIDVYDIYEAISLAAGSLSVVTNDFCLEISNLDLVKQVVTAVCDDVAFVQQVIACIAEKNCHDLKKVCLSFGVSDADAEKIASLITTYGERNGVLQALREKFSCPQIDALAALSALLDNSPYAEKIKFDFSVVNDMNYYNGFVFKGFVDGVPRGVLAGGQYDNLMKKMNRTSGAVGFAIYFDRLEDLSRENAKTDVDLLLLYDENVDVATLARKVNALIALGMSVSAQKAVPENLRCKETLDLRGEGTKC